MSAIAVPVLVIAGITGAVGLAHLVLHLRGLRDRAHVVFACTCLCATVYDLLCARLYSAQSLAEGVVWQRLQFTVLAFLGLCLATFVADFVRLQRRGLVTGITVFYLVWGGLSLVLPLRFIVDAGAPLIKEFPRLGVRIHEGTPAPLANLLAAIGILTFLYLAFVTWRHYRRGNRESGALLLGLTSLCAGVGYDTLVSLGWLSSIYVLEYAYLFLLLAMSYALAGRLVDYVRTKEELAESERKYEQLFEVESDALVLYEAATGRLLDVNHAACELYGYHREKFVTLPLTALLPTAPAPGSAPTLRQAAHRRADGRELPVDVVETRFQWHQLSVALAVIRDRTDERRVAEALAAERNHLAVTLRSLAEGVVTTDRNGRIVLLNRAAEELCGWPVAEAQGQPFEDVFRIVELSTPTRGATPAQEMLSTTHTVLARPDTKLVARDGRERVVAINSAPLRLTGEEQAGLVIVIRDLTETRRMEAELLRADKLESLALLAGGIAHDFNNLLVGILGNISLAKLDTGQGETPQLLAEAERGAERARKLTSQLLTFARNAQAVKRPVCLINTIEETVSFACRGSHVRAALDLPESLWITDVDEGQVGQVIHNIAINAVQAMPNGGVITVRAENLELTAPGRLPLKPGKYVVIAIQDQGVGIPPANLARIFDPYFTTKPRGTGLGLASCEAIILRHEGHIRAESTPGAGATFFVYLPATGMEGRREKTEIIEPVSGEGRVLIMDDDENVCKALGAMLRRLGYEPDTCAEGDAALAKVREAQAAGRAYAAIIMDLTIPGGRGGAETIGELKALDPAIKAIVSSGYAGDPVMAEFATHGFSGALSKPYRVTDLSQLLARLVGRPPGAR